MISAAARKAKDRGVSLGEATAVDLGMALLGQGIRRICNSRPTAVAPTPSAAPLSITERRLMRSCGWCVRIHGVPFAGVCPRWRLDRRCVPLVGCDESLRPTLG